MLNVPKKQVTVIIQFAVGWQVLLVMKKSIMRLSMQMGEDTFFQNRSLLQLLPPSRGTSCRHQILMEQTENNIRKYLEPFLPNSLLTLEGRNCFSKLILQRLL
jgi:hypothetical protein